MFAKLPVAVKVYVLVHVVADTGNSVKVQTSDGRTRTRTRALHLLVQSGTLAEPVLYRRTVG